MVVPFGQDPGPCSETECREFPIERDLDECSPEFESSSVIIDP